MVVCACVPSRVCVCVCTCVHTCVDLHARKPVYALAFFPAKVMEGLQLLLGHGARGTGTGLASERCPLTLELRLKPLLRGRFQMPHSPCMCKHVLPNLVLLFWLILQFLFFFFSLFFLKII